MSQAYTVNLMEENVLRGNSAIVKCHIPSFVAEYVTVSSWIISEDDVEETEIQSNQTISLGISTMKTSSVLSLSSIFPISIRRNRK